MSDIYTGSVCYVDGWHYTVDTDEHGDHPGVPLFLNDDGTYRYATDGDESWHERKHQRYTLLVPEDGSPMVSVTPEQMAEVQKILNGDTQ